jgi:hypothetical protein
LCRPTLCREPDVDYVTQNEPKGSSESGIILDIFLRYPHAKTADP